MNEQLNQFSGDRPIRTPDGNFFSPLGSRIEASDEISLGEIGQLLKRRWKTILLISVSCGAISLGIAFMMTPIFRAEVLLIPADTDQGKSSRFSGLSTQLGELASFAGVGSTGTTKDEAIAIMQSRTLTDKFVEERNLLPVLFEDSWDSRNSRWKSDDPKKIPTLWDSYKLIEKIRQVNEDKKTGLLTLTVDWKDPKLASEWANDLALRTNNFMRSKALARSAANVDYLQDQLKKTSVVEIQTSINSLIEGELKKTMLASGSEEYAFKVIDPAVVPQEKYKPKRSLYLVAGLVFGLLIGLFSAVFKSKSGIDGNGAKSNDAPAID